MARTRTRGSEQTVGQGADVFSGAGACAPNGPITQADLGLLSYFPAVKLRDYHTAQDVQALRSAGSTHFCMAWPDLHPGDRWEDWAAHCLALTGAMYQAGVYEFQTGIEPNGMEADQWGQATDGAWVYAFYLRLALQQVKDKLRGQAGMQRLRLGLPSLQFGPETWPGLPAWKRAFTAAPSPDQPPLTSLCQFACANSYWNQPKDWIDGSWGMSWQDVMDYTGLPTQIAEFGYSGYTRGPSQPGPARSAYMVAVRAQMRARYPLYLSEVQRRGAERAYVFCVGGTPEWYGLQIDEATARACGGK